MTSWYSRILTTTSSSISNLQSRILQSENDGDTEDDTHVCRVLRTYYTEKGRPFPAWLPPDPKAPPPVAPVYVQPQQQVGSRYGAMGQQQQQAGPAGSLSSLWDSNPAAPRQDAPQSLRQGRGAQPAARATPFTQQQSLGGDQGRPVAGQRAGSYQATSPYQRETASAAGGAGGASAQDRLKQRLWGGSRTTSPSGGQGPFQPPPSSGGGGGGSGDYEDRFAPGGSYDSGSRGGGGGGRPYVGANAPWSNADEGFQSFSGGGAGGGGGGGRPGGLPSGPRRGLPSGPRMR
ncbi:Sec1-binding region of Mso1-domain-containing protein [Plectosphaerella plurivora]|uniref:Sec1-binding region of Mso1-domain-containing protein n=1 Tax=Plectosphaerella plurivora TaxID=936078 RepID=A0A9P9AA84_9PEZI|nr:Sec1-binding region of Mso1-domain-containing protein [Plectosphaerella plurivora]